jgi:hypothetical protein
MSQVCQRCYKIVMRACQSETEWSECPHLERRNQDLAYTQCAAAELQLRSLLNKQSEVK